MLSTWRISISRLPDLGIGEGVGKLTSRIVLTRQQSPRLAALSRRAAQFRFSVSYLTFLMSAA